MARSMAPSSRPMSRPRRMLCRPSNRIAASPARSASICSSVTPGCRVNSKIVWIMAFPQQLVEPDGQVADPDPGGVVHRAGDGGRRAHDAHLADPLGPGRTELRLLLVDPH